MASAITARGAGSSDQPFYLIVAGYDRGVFAVEGPMIDDQPWNKAATYARNHQHRIVCGPTGTDRDTLAAEYRRTLGRCSIGQHRKAATVSAPLVIRPAAPSDRLSLRQALIRRTAPRSRPTFEVAS